MDPEQTARHDIDKMLEASGWTLQDYPDLNLGESRGVAIREYKFGKKSTDYALFIDRNPVGVIEAKRYGTTLSGVTIQSNNYLEELSQKFPNAPIKPPFSYESTGIETIFANRCDPNYSSRNVFTFHRPEVLADWLKEEKTLRARLKDTPELDYTNLWPCQFQAIQNLEKSFSENRPRALIQMATGSGKTFTAVTFIYRLIKHARAKRVLFLVDRGNLGRQALREFQQYETPDDGRKFTELYNVQHLQSQIIDPASKVVISTVQRMYSILKGDKKFDDEDDEFSVFEQKLDDVSVEVEYNSDIPIGEFDFIVIDECHRSIYNKWKQVLDYFDSFLIGLTATPSRHTIGFFNNNQVMNYDHERAVADGVNVGYHIFNILTKITKDGSKINAGESVEIRDKSTRKKRQEALDDDVIYTPDDLDKHVVVPDQIRLIISTFKKKLPIIFPKRDVVPKTLIFAKDDSHAEDITKIVREVFAAGNEFCQKITYKTTGDKPENIIASFRNSLYPRIAVTVDMIATGTDIKPLECIIFMRNVRSKIYFDQMKGRGSRVINSNDLQAVTPNAKSKNHFVIVDTVGVCQRAMSDTYSLNRAPGPSLKELMQRASEGRADEESLSTLAYRMARLDRSLDEKDRNEISKAAGITISQMVNKLLDGIDADKQIERAKEKFKTDQPTEEQINQASKEMIQEASKIFDSPKLRQIILDIKKQNEIIIDTPAIDELIEAGYIKEANDLSRQTVDRLEEFIDKNRDELIALQILYSKPYKIRELTFDNIQELSQKIKAPPYNLTPESLWSAYNQLEKSKVKDNPKKMLTDLISIIRFSTGQENILAPFDEEVNKKFEKWLSNQESAGRRFTPEQKEWLDMIKEHIASSISATLDDMDYAPFLQKGGRVKFYKLFGDNYEKILQELQEVLISQ